MHTARNRRAAAPRRGKFAGKSAKSGAPPAKGKAKGSNPAELIAPPKAAKPKAKARKLALADRPLPTVVVIEAPIAATAAKPARKAKRKPAPIARTKPKTPRRAQTPKRKTVPATAAADPAEPFIALPRMLEPLVLQPELPLVAPQPDPPAPAVTAPAPLPRSQALARYHAGGVLGLVTDWLRARFAGLSGLFRPPKAPKPRRRLQRTAKRAPPRPIPAIQNELALDAKADPAQPQGAPPPKIHA